jgi:hypothetical protein
LVAPETERTDESAPSHALGFRVEQISVGRRSSLAAGARAGCSGAGLPGQRRANARASGPVWFGILFCRTTQISYPSPPFGPAAFYLKGVAPPEISLQGICKAHWRFPP